MAACCGKSKRGDDATDDATRPTRICPPNELQLERLHTIMDELGEAASAHAKVGQKRTRPQQKKDTKV